MILLDQPYVSDFLRQTIKENNLQAVDTGNVIQDVEVRLLDHKSAIESFYRDKDQRICTISENAIAWVYKNLGKSDLSEKIEVFKNKKAFRDLLQDLYPDLYYREVLLDDIKKLEYNDLPAEFIIKPSVGFFSMGVYKVTGRADWEKVKQSIDQDIAGMAGVYPDAVLDTAAFIVEGIIEGEEFAFDSYLDENNRPVILGIMKHIFASETDVSDRLYMTSKRILQDNLSCFNEFIIEVGKRTGIKNFLLHTEVRIDKNGRMIPIEVNPMRFGAWCTSAELAHYAFGTNSYLNFLNNKKPDWESILSSMDDSLYSLIILDNSTGIPSKEIQSFDIDAVLEKLECPIEVRRMDYMKYPIFAMIFTKTSPEHYGELDSILKSDLKEFVQTK